MTEDINKQISHQLKQLKQQLSRSTSEVPIDQLESTFNQLNQYAEALRLHALEQFLATGAEEKDFQYRDPTYEAVKECQQLLVKKKKDANHTLQQQRDQQHARRRAILHDLRKIIHRRFIDPSYEARIEVLKQAWDQLPGASDRQQLAYETLMQRRTKQQEILSAFRALDEEKKEEAKRLRSEELKVVEEAARARSRHLEALEQHLSAPFPDTTPQWQKLNQSIEAIQSQWKQLPARPAFDASDRACIKTFNQRIRTFYEAKRAHFATLAEAYQQQLTLRQSLIAEAKHLLEAQTLSTDAFFELQKKWKTAGPVAYKDHKSIHEQWKELQNQFYGRKKLQGQQLEEEQKEQYTLYDPLNKSLSTLLKLEKISIEQLSSALDQCPEPTSSLPDERCVEHCVQQLLRLLDQMIKAELPPIGPLISLLKSFKKKTQLDHLPKLEIKQKQLKGRIQFLRQELHIFSTNLDRLRSNSQNPMRQKIIQEIQKTEQQIKEQEYLLKLYQVLV